MQMQSILSVTGLSILSVFHRNAVVSAKDGNGDLIIEGYIDPLHSFSIERDPSSYNTESSYGVEVPTSYWKAASTEETGESLHDRLTDYLSDIKLDADDYLTLHIYGAEPVKLDGLTLVRWGFDGSPETAAAYISSNPDLQAVSFTRVFEGLHMEATEVQSAIELAKAGNLFNAYDASPALPETYHLDGGIDIFSPVPVPVEELTSSSESAPASMAWLIITLGVLLGGALLLGIYLTIKEFPACINLRNRCGRNTTNNDSIEDESSPQEDGLNEIRRRRRLPATEDALLLSSKSHANEPLSAVDRLLSPRILALSCITQVAWIALGYFLFKRYKQYRAEAREDKEGAIPLYN